MVPNKRDRRRAILADEPASHHASGEIKLIRFGSPRHAADRCTLLDAPAQFALCLECPYNGGAHGDGIRCVHRFGVDPTLVDGAFTQMVDDEIVWLKNEL